jgi:hypothetical protein
LQLGRYSGHDCWRCGFGLLQVFFIVVIVIGLVVRPLVPALPPIELFDLALGIRQTPSSKCWVIASPGFDIACVFLVIMVLFLITILIIFLEIPHSGLDRIQAVPVVRHDIRQFWNRLPKTKPLANVEVEIDLSWSQMRQRSGSTLFERQWYCLV